jgi:hypothetical protein
VSDRRRQAAEATLARLGLDPAAVAAGTIEAAALLPHLAGAGAEPLVDALGVLADTPAAAALLADLEAHAPNRSLRKALRRALYVVRQRGVPLPERAAAEKPAPRVVEPDVEGLLSHVDGRGDRLAWLVRPQAAGGALLVAAQLNEPEGLRDVQLADVTRKQLRAARQQLERDAGLRLVPADWHVVDALLVEAHERAQSDDRHRDYLRLRARLVTTPPRPPAEPVSRHVATPGPDEAAALGADSGALLALPEFVTWWPAPEALAPWMEEIGALRDSPLVVSRAAQEERVRDVIRTAIATLVPAAVFARRLEGSAYVLAETGRAPAARQALAVAAALRAAPDRVADVPFAVAYVERALGRVLAAASAEQKEAERSALVVTPGQFLRDRSRAHPGRTRG